MITSVPEENDNSLIQPDSLSHNMSKRAAKYYKFNITKKNV